MTMGIPVAIDLYDVNDDWKAFAIAMGITGFSGILLILSNKQNKIAISGRQAFMLTALAWIFLSVFSALPFVFAMRDISFTDAVFEAVSGLTTTGSTVMTGLDAMPRGILIWRAVLQWLGGIGIIVMAISVLPFLKVGGMQLFRLESSEKEKVMANVADMTKALVIVYTLITVLCGLSYHYAGLTYFEASVHAMTTLSTGGFSTTDNSFSNFSDLAKCFAIFFMLIACFPFVIFIKMYAHSIRDLFNDEQIMGFIKLQCTCVAIIIGYMVWHDMVESGGGIVDILFNTVSVGTGTGYASFDYLKWGVFATGFIFFISAFGGCAGSASCGIKIFRLQILFAVAKNQIQMLIYPRGVFTIDYNKHPLSVQVAGSVMAFFFIYITCYVIIALGLLACDLDFITALSGAMTTLANVGPGLGDIIGPTGTFQPLPDNAKWIMIASMLLGRLEFFTLLVFLSPRFWRH